MNENDLILDWQSTGNVASRNKVILNHMGALAQRARAYPLPTSDDREDLIAEGVLGLIEAMNKFDTQNGVKFLTYGMLYVRKYISNYLLRNTGGFSYKAKDSGVIALVYRLSEFDGSKMSSIKEFSEKHGIPIKSILAFCSSKIVHSPVEAGNVGVNGVDDFVKEDLLKKVYTIIDEECTDKEKRSIKAYLSGDNNEATAKALGLNTWTVGYYYRKAVKRIQERLVLSL